MIDNCHYYSSALSMFINYLICLFDNYCNFKRKRLKKRKLFKNFMSCELKETGSIFICSPFLLHFSIQNIVFKCFEIYLPIFMEGFLLLFLKKK